IGAGSGRGRWLLLPVQDAKAVAGSPGLDDQQCRFGVQPGDDDLEDVGKEQVTVRSLADWSGGNHPSGDLRTTGPLAFLALLRMKGRAAHGETRIPFQLRPLARPWHRTKL